MIIGLILLCGITYSIGYYMRISVLSKMRTNDIQTYKQILGDHTESWIERGWQGPSDIAIHWRLHKYIGSHGKSYFSRTSWIAYRVSVWAAVVLFFVLLPVVLIKIITF